jgi:hypothetical protein
MHEKLLYFGVWQLCFCPLRLTQTAEFGIMIE